MDNTTNAQVEALWVEILQERLELSFPLVLCLTLSLMPASAFSWTMPTSQHCVRLSSSRVMSCAALSSAYSFILLRFHADLCTTTPISPREETLTLDAVVLPAPRLCTLFDSISQCIRLGYPVRGAQYTLTLEHSHSFTIGVSQL